MKKILLLAIVMTTALLSYSQDSLLSQLSDTSKLTVFKVYNDVKAGISGLAAGLKVGATHVYEVLIKQQTVISITYLLLIILLFICTFIGYKVTKSTYLGHRKLCEITSENKGYKDAFYDLDESPKGPLSVVLSILTAGCFITGIVTLSVNFNTIVTGFINPEYGAMKDIINFIR